MKKITIVFVLFLVSFSLFSQKAMTARDAAIIELMHVKKGMISVNSLTQSMSKNMDKKQAASFKVEMDAFKDQLISTALSTFKKDYTAEEISYIYTECTSDKINYSDLTNDFFKKWRHLKGNLYFKKAKESYFKYQ